LDRTAQGRLELRERLGDAVLDRTGLAGKPATLDGGNDVVLAGPVGDLERLVDHQAQGRTGEVHGLVAAVDGDLARTGLQPDAGDGVLAATGGIGPALRVDLLGTQRRR